MLQAVIADMVAAHPRYRAPNAVPHIDEGGRVVNDCTLAKLFVQSGPTLSIEHP